MGGISGSGVGVEKILLKRGERGIQTVSERQRNYFRINKINREIYLGYNKQI